MALFGNFGSKIQKFKNSFQFHSIIFRKIQKSEMSYHVSTSKKIGTDFKIFGTLEHRCIYLTYLHFCSTDMGSF